MRRLNEIYDNLGLAHLERLPLLRKLAARSSTTPRQLTALLSLLVCLLCIPAFTGRHATKLILLLLPGLETLGALESRDGATAARLIYYWISFSFCMLLQPLLDRALAALPFGHLLQFAFLLALWLPSTAARLAFGDRVISPLYERLKAGLDAYLRRVPELARPKSD